MKKKFIVYFYVFLNFTSYVWAQYKPTDSLYFALIKYEDKEAALDSVYVNMLNQLAYKLHTSQPDTAFFYAQKALEVSEQINFPKGKAHAIKQQSINYTNQKNYPKALEYWSKSYLSFASIRETRETAHCLEQIGDIHQEQENLAESLDSYQKSLAYLEFVRDKKAKTILINKIATVYLQQNNIEKSEKKAHEALELNKGTKNFAEIATSNTILYKIAKLNKDFVKALDYYETAQQYQDSASIVNAKEAEKQAKNAQKERERQLKTLQELLQKNETLRKLEAERQELIRATLEKQNKKDANLATEIAKKDKEIQRLNSNQYALKKDKELQRIEAEREKNARLVLQYHSEAERLLASARQEKDKHKQDSLHKLAQSKQAEVDIYLRQEQKLKAESRERSLEVLKEKEAKEFQQYINYLVLAGLCSMIIFAYFIYKSRQKEKRAKESVEEEKQKSDALLLNILPLETAQELKQTGTAKPKHYDLITVLFTDFKGFTHIAEKFTPTQVIEELNYCFLAFDEICEKHNLEKIKTIGDAYMCAGGLPMENTTNPVDVVRAGLEMQEWMARWKTEKEAKGEPVWELRLGIHSGEAVAGVVGKNKFAYDIWGDTVNLASRMESSGEVGKVNISETTYELVKHVFECTHRGAIKAKNKGEIEMYFVEKAL